MTANEFVGAIDQGTTGTRWMIFDRHSRVIANAYQRHEQSYPKPGWVEHDPVEIWEATASVINEGLSEAGIDATQLAAIGITNPRETTVLWDRETGEPIHPAIVWQDRRTTKRVEALIDAGASEWIRARTGLEIDAYFSATKAEWLLEQESDSLRDRANAGELCLGTIDSWLIYQLTGNHVTDVTNASRTMLYNIHELEWDERLLETFDIPRAILPEVRPSVDPEGYGHTHQELFGASIPVTGALGDQQAALFGQTCFNRGEAKNTYGTGSFYLTNTGNTPVDSEHGLLTTIAYQIGEEAPHYALEGSIFITGAAVEWLEDMALIPDAEASEPLAATVDSTDGVYFVPAFTGLGAPHWDGRARGTIIGITRGTRPAHLVRAALEAIAFQTRDVAEAMEADLGETVSRLHVDGGAVQNNLLCQLQADLLDRPIIRTAINETTALGAAYAAGLAVGYWEGLDHLREQWEEERGFTSQADPDTVEQRYNRWKEAVKRSQHWAKESN